ncbi:MAG: hypothetical protein AABX05_01760 [Nanoarchaeota archaeon]
MAFENEKKTFLAKLDKSKKGSIDEKIVPLLNRINQTNDYYSTSSCSGRVYLWKGTGKKSETQWLRVSHDLISENFFEIKETGVIWLRLEGMILHVACRDIGSANRMIDMARKFYKEKLHIERQQ